MSIADANVDVLVVGAGPAGALAAVQLARTGLSVHIVERAPWPRPKVCGGCLSPAGVALLESVGLGQLPDRAGAATFEQLLLHHRGGQHTLPLGRGVAISRQTLDATLIDVATAQGARFTPATRATVPQTPEPLQADPGIRPVVLHSGGGTETINARMIVAADGLTGPITTAALGPAKVASNARIGLGSVIDAQANDYAPATIHMGWFRHGYTGAVVVEQGQLCIAAAIDPVWLRQQPDTLAALHRAAAAAGMPPLPPMERAILRGTPPLTRHRRILGAPRLLAIGDAAGYVEPFTGEGMTWAMASALAVTPFILENLSRWDETTPARWTDHWQRMLHARQRMCGLVSAALRSGWLAPAAVRLLAECPPLARRIAAWMHRPIAMAAQPINPGGAS